MKYVWMTLIALIAMFGGLFLFQNHTRTLSTDVNGLQLSFDLGLWGVGTSDVGLTTFVLVVFTLGSIFGVLIPTMVKDLLNKR